MIKAVIFDLFGVLVMDSLGMMHDELVQSDPVKKAKIIDILHASHHGFLTSEESSAQIAALLGLSYKAYRRRVMDGETRNETLLKYISELKKNYKTAILSNIATGSIYKRFSQDELDEYFDTVVTSGDEGHAKPEPEIYELTADRLGVRFDECIFTDDNPDYCEAARSVGMRAIRYASFEQFRSELEKVLDAN